MVDTSLARWLAGAEILRSAQDDTKPRRTSQTSLNAAHGKFYLQMSAAFKPSCQAFLDKCHMLRYNMNEWSFILMIVHSLLWQRE
jgi:hypothetical protein